MSLYHYDVYLRASHGTVKRMVSISRRSTKLAGENAAAAVARTVREPVKVLDVVPLRCIKGTATEQGRGRKQMKVTKTRFVQSRRPKARASLKLSRKGKLYEPKWAHSEQGAVYQVGRVSEGLSEKPIPGLQTCSSEACIERGTCTHSRPPIGKFFLVFCEVTARPKGKRKLSVTDRWVWVLEAHVRNRSQAAEQATEHLCSRPGVVSVRVLDTFTDHMARKQFATKANPRVIDPRNYFRSR